ncbi:MAG: thioredoxin domain-containing protein [Candidatus Rokuibacteriota bacterium]
MTRRRGSMLGTSLMAVVLGSWAVALAQTSEVPTGTAARVGGDTISLAELEQSVATELSRLDQQRQELLGGKLDQLIADRLLGQEATRRGVSVDALLRDEIEAKAGSVTEADVADFMNQNRARLREPDNPELRGKVAEFLRQQRLSRRRDAYVAGLRTQTPVQVYLKEPEPIRVKVDPGVGFARGAREAPVTIVEFSDFQCPYCRSVVATLKEVAARYPDRVRWVFRDFPIENLHPEAPLAHEAARCAGDQGKFWPYHDLLFEQTTLTPDALKQYAARVGLEATAFAQCLDSRRHRAAVAADVAAGLRLGVTGTPTYFVNGRPLVGNLPLTEFQRVIELELARTATTK